MATPFKLGDVWGKKDDHDLRAVIVRVLVSRERRDYEAWAETRRGGVGAVRFDGVDYPFPADDAHGRGCHTLIAVEDWDRVGSQW